MSVGDASVEIARTSVSGALGLLSDVAVSVGRGDDTDVVFADLVEGIRATLDADRASLFLLDARGRLVPTTSSARRRDGGLYQKFRSMQPIPLEAVTSGWETLREARVVVVPDASSNPLVPASWQRQFDLTGLVLAPLRAGDEPVGLLAVEGGLSGRLSAEQSALLEGCAALAGLAVHGLTAVARDSESVLGAASSIRTAPTLTAAAERALDVMMTVADAFGGAWALLHRDHVDLLAARGMADAGTGPRSLAELPTALFEACREAWRTNAALPVAWHIDGRDILVVPVPRGQQLFAALVLEIPSPGRSLTARLTAAASVVGMAFGERYAAEQRDLESALAATIDRWSTTTASPAELYAELVSSVRLMADAQVLDVVAMTRAIARDSGLRPLTGQLRTLVGEWRRRTTPPAPKRYFDWWAVPLHARSKLVGAAVVAALPSTPVAATRLERLMSAYAGTVMRAIDSASIAQAAPVLDQVAARAQLASRCYGETGRLLAAVTTELRQIGRRDHSEEVAGSLRLLAEALQLLSDATDALHEPDNATAGIRRTLERLFQQLEQRGAPAVQLHVSGRLPEVPTASRIALLRATRDAMTLFRTTRAALVHANLHGGDSLVVALSADTVLGALFDTDGGAIPLALRRMRGWLEPVSGRVTYTSDRGNPVLTLSLPVPPPAGSGPRNRRSAVVTTAPAGESRPERSSPGHPGEDGREAVVPLRV